MKIRKNKITQFFSKLGRDTSGLAMIEFGYTLPLLMTLGGFGLEMSHLTNTNHKLSQAGMALADNMSRVGQLTALSTTQIRESDIVDSFIGMKRQTGDLNITANGRVILSSLQTNATGGQWIQWQRCIGTKVIPSAYGAQGIGITGSNFLGMGPSAARVTAPPGSAVMFVEIVYDYRSLFGTMFIPARTIRYEASFIVRDERDLTQIFNPSPAATVHSCNTYAT